MAGADSADEVVARLRVARRCSRRLPGDVARLAGRIAEMEEQIASARERSAAAHPERSAELLASAEHARAFARRERREQERWQGVHDAPD